MSDEQLLRDVYAAFNARDLDWMLDQMTDDVDWPNAWEGGRLNGREAVREYWTRQWAEIDPLVEPTAITSLADGRLEVEVAQTVRSLDGSVIGENTVLHTYTIRDGLIAGMDVSER
ncbi:MAG: nuclear transport factor 2 family protein [Thermoleophilaceae bacterium]